MKVTGRKQLRCYTSKDYGIPVTIIDSDLFFLDIRSMSFISDFLLINDHNHFLACTLIFETFDKRLATDIS